MNKRIVRAALVACLMGSAAVLAVSAPLAPAFAADKPAAPTGPTVTKPVGLALQPAQKLLAAGDYPSALTLIKTAQALPDQTPYDTYTINNFLASAYIGLKDYDNAFAAYVAMVESPAMPDTDKANSLHNATLLATQLKHFDKSIKYAQAMIALGGPADPAVLSALAQSYYFTNDFDNAAAMAQKAIAATAAGQAPSRGALEIKLGAQIKAKKQADAEQTLETILTWYDDPDEWAQLVDVSLGTKGLKDIDAVHMYRLRMLTKATAKSEDYTIAAAMAVSIAYPVEADAILNAGAGVIERNAKNNALIADVRGKAAKDRQTIGGFDGIARKAASGELDLRLAETCYGYERFADAAEAARRALTKGGAKADPNEANMVLAESLLRQGMTADAIAAFNALHNPSPGMARAAQIWLLYANRKYGAAAPAAH